MLFSMLKGEILWCTKCRSILVRTQQMDDLAAGSARLFIAS